MMIEDGTWVKIERCILIGNVWKDDPVLEIKKVLVPVQILYRHDVMSYVACVDGSLTVIAAVAIREVMSKEWVPQ